LPGVQALGKDVCIIGLFPRRVSVGSLHLKLPASPLSSQMVEAAKKAEATAAQRLGYNPYQVLSMVTADDLVLHTNSRLYTYMREEDRD
jgi:hypothetical protein